MVFGLRILRDIERWKLNRTTWKNKEEYISAIREHRKYVSEKKNPYFIEDDPYMFLLLETILSPPAYSSKWTNGVKRSWKELDNAFMGYLRALAAEARAVDRGFDGKGFLLFGQDFKIISERGKKGSLKPMSG